jgi:hypothetical protein
MLHMLLGGKRFENLCGNDVIICLLYRFSGSLDKFESEKCFNLKINCVKTFLTLKRSLIHYIKLIRILGNNIAAGFDTTSILKLRIL